MNYKITNLSKSTNEVVVGVTSFLEKRMIYTINLLILTVPSD